MASEVALPDNAHIDNSNPPITNDVPMTNGDHEMTGVDGGSQNNAAFAENASHAKPEPTVDLNNLQSKPGPDPAETNPIEGVSSGIAPVADFIPKDARTSHPTPPPDEPLATSEANVDSSLSTSNDQSAESTTAETAPTGAGVAVSSTESSLIRQRDDDDDDDESDEPAAKRSKVESHSTGNIPIRDASTTAPSRLDPGEPEQVPRPDDIKSEAVHDSTSPVAPESGVDASAAASLAPNSSESKPTEADAAQSVEAVESRSNSSAVVSAQPMYSRDPMTPAQSKYLQEKWKNLKKTKNSAAFLFPVDAVALNIPSYADIVTSPMDLSTMENKLKNGEYSSVQAFADDFDLIISNSRKFNGETHAVTQAGLSMEAYFRKILESVPRTDQPVPQKTQPKKPSPKPPVPRRESRSAAVASSPTNTTAAATFALQADGTPQIRRDSTINRPSRAIKPPQNREISYAKPKRKEAQLELKFCDHVLSQMRGPKYTHVNAVFQQPVDPVALNIPHYRQVVKHPMDLSTISNKLKQGEYAKASEFKKDFDLMIQNCLNFNPPGNAVRDMGLQFQRVFEDLWRSREKWERGRKAETQRATSASADEESGDEEEEEEEEEDDATHEDQAGKIKALQKQLAEMQNALAGLNKVPAKQKKSKVVAKQGKKTGAVPSAKSKPAPKPKTNKKPKQVTYEEKQEISEAVGKMNNAQIEELTRIITTNCKKYADQEEMELEIDDLPNDVQVMLLQYVRGLFGNPHKRHRAASPDDIAAVDDDDFEPDRKSRGGGGGKRKKHKPMGKKEQQDAISSIQAQLRQFQTTGASGSESPTNSHGAANQGADSSDDESEESEEE